MILLKDYEFEYLKYIIEYFWLSVDEQIDCQILNKNEFVTLFENKEIL